MADVFASINTTLPRLSAINSNDYPPNHEVYVATVKDWWVVDKASAQAADGITCIAPASGPGRLRRLNRADPSWLTQATWVIDPGAGGSDENTGVDNVHAIKTCGERQRRCGRGYIVSTPTTITYLASPAASDIELFSRTLVGYNSTLTIQGQRTVAATGTLTGFTTFNRATQTKNSIADSGLAGGFAAHVGRLCRITGGARVNSAWIISRDLGGGAAEISSPGLTATTTFGSFSRTTPQIGDPYEIVTLPVVTCGEFSFGQGANQYPSTGFGRVILQDLQLDFGNISTTAFASGFLADFVKIVVARCKFGAAYFKGSTISLFQCHHSGYALVEAGATQLHAGVHTTHVQANVGGRAFLDHDELLQGGQLTLFRGGYVEVGTACVFDKVGDGVSVNQGSSLLCSPGADGVTALWGTGNTGQGISITSGGSATWWTGAGGAKPTVNVGLGSGRELRLNGKDFLWTDAPVQSGGALAGEFTQ